MSTARKGSCCSCLCRHARSAWQLALEPGQFPCPGLSLVVAAVASRRYPGVPQQETCNPPGFQVWGQGPPPGPCGPGCTTGRAETKRTEAPPQQPLGGEEPIFSLAWEPPFGPDWEAAPDSPEKRGGFHKEGEGPSFGGFWFLLPVQKEPPAGSVPFFVHSAHCNLGMNGVQYHN